MAQAKKYEAERDFAMANYHNYEFGSAAYQIGIVLASAAVITGMMVLVYVSAGARHHRPHVHRTRACSRRTATHDVLHWFETLLAGSGTH